MAAGGDNLGEVGDTPLSDLMTGLCAHLLKFLPTRRNSVPLVKGCWGKAR